MRRGTTVALIEGYLFGFVFYSMGDAGHKAMAVNLRGIAAMDHCSTPKPNESMAISKSFKLTVEDTEDLKISGS